MNGQAPTLSVVILNWNRADLTIACYQSLLRQTYRDVEWIIADNASTDDSMQRLAAECPGARLVRNAVNAGTGGGFAFGAAQARGAFILFLCNDTVLDPDVLERLMAVMTAHPDCGVLGAKHVLYNRPDTVELLGYCVDKFGVQHCFGSGEPDVNQTGLRDAWVSGTVLMVRRSAYEEAGGYDPVHFTLNDEVDLCWRIRIHGWRLMVCADARVVHHHFATLRLEKRVRCRYWAERHLIRLLLKNYSARSLARVLPQYAGLLFLELLYLCAQGLWGMAWSDLRAIAWNVRMLPDTWRHHRRIQRTRRIPDSVLRREMWPGCVKLQWGLQLWRQRSSLKASLSET